MYGFVGRSKMWDNRHRSTVQLDLAKRYSVKPVCTIECMLNRLLPVSPCSGGRYVVTQHRLGVRSRSEQNRGLLVLRSAANKMFLDSNEPKFPRSFRYVCVLESAASHEILYLVGIIVTASQRPPFSWLSLSLSSQQVPKRSKPEMKMKMSH